MKNPIELLRDKTDLLRRHQTAVTQLQKEVLALRSVIPLLIDGEPPEVRALVKELLESHARLVPAPELLPSVEERVENMKQAARRLLTPDDVKSKPAKPQPLVPYKFLQELGV